MSGRPQRWATGTRGLARDGIEPDDLFTPETRDALAI
jgi:hypothetical protein